MWPIQRAGPDDVNRAADRSVGDTCETSSRWGLQCWSWEKLRVPYSTTKVARASPLEFLCSWRRLLRTTGLKAAPAPRRRLGHRVFPEQGRPGRLVSWVARLKQSGLSPYPKRIAHSYRSTHAHPGRPPSTNHAPLSPLLQAVLVQCCSMLAVRRSVFVRRHRQSLKAPRWSRRACGR